MGFTPEIGSRVAKSDLSGGALRRPGRQSFTMESPAILRPPLKSDIPEINFKDESIEPSMAERLRVCVQYGAVSVSLTLFNRAVFSVYRFNYPACFTTLQIVLSIIYLYGFHFSGRLHLGRFTLQGAIKARPERGRAGRP